MSIAQPTFTVAQEYELVLPAERKAFPIPCDDWIRIQRRLGECKTEPWIFHTLGSILIGAALSVWIGLYLSTSPHAGEANATAEGGYGLYILVASSLTVCGAFALILANRERRDYRRRTSDIVEMMEAITDRFPK